MSGWMDGYGFEQGTEVTRAAPALRSARRVVTIAVCPQCECEDLKIRTSGEGRHTELRCSSCGHQWRESGDIAFSRVLLVK